MKHVYGARHKDKVQKEERQVARSSGRTIYSEKIKGARGNYNWAARFDHTDGYIGITQFDGDVVNDRVLLSPAQTQHLLDFIRGKTA